MKKIVVLFLVLLSVLSICSCSKMSDEKENEIIKTVSWQCEHNIKLAFDKTANIEVIYDISQDTYTIYVINTGLSAEEMANFDWHGNGSVVLNMENSINQLCSSVKKAFDESDLKDENYTIYMHFTDTNKKIYFTSENGVPTYSAWD